MPYRQRGIAQQPPCLKARQRHLRRTSWRFARVQRGAFPRLQYQSIQWMRMKIA
jgi:hypothetical protein